MWFSFQTSAMILEHFTLCPDIERCLEELKINMKLAIGLSRQHALNNPRIRRSDIFCFPPSNNIHTYSVLMPTREDFPLLPHIDDLIDRFVEHGLIYLWNRNSQNYTTMRLMHKYKGPQALTVDHLLGAFVILAIGLVSATSVFSIEYLISWQSKKCRKTKICRKFVSQPKTKCRIMKQSIMKSIYRRPKHYPIREY